MVYAKVGVCSYIRLRLIFFFCFFTRRTYSPKVRSKAPTIMIITAETAKDAPTTVPMLSSLLPDSVGSDSARLLVATGMMGFSTTSV